MPFGFHRDRFLQFLLHRRSQQPRGRPFVAAAADDASHKTIIRLCRMIEAANPPNIVRSRVAAPAFEVRSWRASAAQMRVLSGSRPVLTECSIDRCQEIASIVLRSTLGSLLAPPFEAPQGLTVQPQLFTDQCVHRKLSRQRGQVMIMFTLMLVPMFGFLGLVADLGYMHFIKESA